jgi:hypothetical protein
MSHPQRINDSRHPHPLELLNGQQLSSIKPPDYANGEYLCDACGQNGNGNVYHCSQCDYDLHPVCYSLKCGDEERGESTKNPRIVACRAPLRCEAIAQVDALCAKIHIVHSMPKVNLGLCMQHRQTKNDGNSGVYFFPPNCLSFCCCRLR